MHYNLLILPLSACALRIAKYGHRAFVIFWTMSSTQFNVFMHFVIFYVTTILHIIVNLLLVLPVKKIFFYI